MYKCLQQHEWITSLGYTIAPLKLDDMEILRKFRNAQIPILRQNVSISEDEQRQYYLEHVATGFAEERPTQILLSYSKDAECLGYGGLVHIDWSSKRAEVSFLLNPDIEETSSEFEQHFMDYFQILRHIAFTSLGLHKLTALVFALRPKMPQLLEKAGFYFEGTLKDHVFKLERWFDALQFGMMNSSNAIEKMHEGVLITSISKKIPLIQAVREASHRAGAFQKIYGADINPECVARYAVDHFWKYKPLAELHIDEVIQYCKEHGIGAIIPTRDLELLYWAKHKDHLLHSGIHVLVSSKEAITSLRDKKLFADMLTAEGLSAIPTYETLDEVDAAELVVKERHGSGAKGLGLKLTKSQAKRWAEKLQDPVYQPYIEGKEYSVDVYVATNGKLHGIVVRSRDFVVDGESQVTTTEFHQDIIDYISRVVKIPKLALYGHCLFQVILSQDGKIYIIECNPRFGGASTASIAVGLDSFYWFFTECLSKSLDIVPFHRAEYNIRQVRYPTDKVLVWS